MQAQVLTLPLSVDKVAEIKVGKSQNTNIFFPAEPTSVVGYGLSATKDDFITLVGNRERQGIETAIVQWQEVGNLQSFRLIMKGDPIEVTIEIAGSLYVIKLIPSDKHHTAIKFYDADSTKPTAREIQANNIIQNRLNMSDNYLVALLKKAKEKDALEEYIPNAYADWKTRHEKDGLRYTLDDILTSVTRITQIPKDDSLVFQGEITNQSSKLINLNPYNAKILVNDREYPATISECSDILLAGETKTFNVLLMGDGLGGKDHLALNGNDFRVMIPEGFHYSSDSLLPPPLDKPVVNYSK